MRVPSTPFPSLLIHPFPSPTHGFPSVSFPPFSLEVGPLYSSYRSSGAPPAEIDFLVQFSLKI